MGRLNYREALCFHLAYRRLAWSEAPRFAGKGRRKKRSLVPNALPVVQGTTLRSDDFRAGKALKVRVIERVDSSRPICRQGGNKLQIEDGSAAHEAAPV